MKPSCAVTKLIDANGSRPFVCVEVARAGEALRELADEPCPRQKSRTASRYLPFHSAQRTGKFPTW